MLFPDSPEPGRSSSRPADDDDAPASERQASASDDDDAERSEPSGPAIDIERAIPWPPLETCHATKVLAVAIVVAYVMEFIVGAVFDPVRYQIWRIPPDPIKLLAVGANSAILVEAGEWQRLITGNLLHGGFLHLVLNLIALLFFGAFFELLLGPRRFLAIFLTACLGGSLASAYLTKAPIAVGASTGLLGLVGANVVLAWRFSTDRRQTLRSQGWLLFLALVFPVVIPNADHFGHLGGLLAGMAVMIFLAPEKDLETLKAMAHAPLGRDPLVSVLAAGLVFLFAGTALWTAYIYAREGPRPTAVSFLQAAPREDILGLLLLNSAAWTLAIDPEARSDDLRVARSGMAWIDDQDKKFEETLAEHDTMATILFRLGEVDRAIDVERRVLVSSQDREVTSLPMNLGIEGEIPFFASQLARFEWERFRADGPRIEPGFPAAQAVLVHDPALSCASSPPSGQGENAGIYLSGNVRHAEVHVVLVDGNEEPVAFMKAYVGDSGGPWIRHSGRGAEARLGCDVRAEVTLVVALGPDEPGTWQIWKMDEQAAELPR